MSAITAEQSFAEERPSSNTLPPRRVGRIQQLQDQVTTLIGRMKVAVLYGGSKEGPRLRSSI